MQGQVKVVPARWWHVPALSRLIRETRRRPARGGGCAVVPAVVAHAGADPSLAWTVPVPGVAGPRSFVAERRDARWVWPRCGPWRSPGSGRWSSWPLSCPRPLGRGAAAAGRAGAPAVRPRPAGGASPRRAVRFRRGAGRGADRGPDRGGGRALRAVQAGGLLARGAGVRLLSPRGRGDRAAPTRARAVDGLRPQRRADSYGLLQLYQGSTPKLVQMAEGKRSRSWDLPVAGWGGRLARGRAERRWVVERDARKVGWLRLAAPGPGPAGAAPGGAAGRSSGVRPGPGLCWRWPWRRVAPRPGACWCGHGSTSRGSWRLSRRRISRPWGAAC